MVHGKVAHANHLPPPHNNVVEYPGKGRRVAGRVAGQAGRQKQAWHARKIHGGGRNSLPNGGWVGRYGGRWHGGRMGRNRQKEQSAGKERKGGVLLVQGFLEQVQACYVPVLSYLINTRLQPKGVGGRVGAGRAGPRIQVRHTGMSQPSIR